MAASEEPEAPTEPLDVACGLENMPVSVWPPGARPGPFQYSPDHVAGPGADADPSEITFPGCACLARPCVPGTCSCLHRVVQRGLQRPLQVFRTDGKGWGLRTLAFIPRGRFVCEYAGEVLGFSEAQRRIQRQTEQDSNYIIAVREHVAGGRVMETFVDPARVGNVGRFLNHSCEPNLLMVPVRVDSMVPRLALFAARDISPGEELSYDYSGRFLNRSDGGDKGRPGSGKPRKPCFCGSASCAAFLPYDASLYCTPEKPAPGQEGEV
ncbi:PREDICTED: histone-lysine N-methyltransferase SETMAR [Myotis brandtii]|uniref:histone-lysine N-methyltransferase SETMAR n=1 Tax=Myotis brandtii TaxID=109478 RepID=UPI0003BBDE2A|nr:PREDICTED: histone-lysine N-methyltransferase SETMAR [Myotis brandtii]